jgi:uncharacterized protein (DUF362 family)/NAD-dependent dihydropyrimidine dehydrogenase PreA subunit
MGSAPLPAPAARSAVALVSCPDYDPQRVQDALRRGLDLLGGIGRFVSRGERILLKPNVLTGAAPERNVCTHPAVFAGVARLLLAAGAQVRYGDSPGFGGIAAAAAKAGLAEAARGLGVPLADFTAPAQVSFNEALIARQLLLARAALEADGIVSLPKMKTHGFMRITGAVKNLFGCVPGIRKGEYHVKMPRSEHFAAMLVDVCRRLRPRLNVMDGIVAMEGNGPGSGTPRMMKVLLLSDDPLALDAVFCRLVRLKPEYVPTMRPGAEGGLGAWEEGAIAILGDDAGALACPDFQVVREPAADMDRSFPYYLKYWLTPRPLIDPRRCRKCGVCSEVCPLAPKAVLPPGHDPGQVPVYDYRRCIRCYCCQEMCPHGAISVKRPLLSRLIHR